MKNKYFFKKLYFLSLLFFSISFYGQNKKCLFKELCVGMSKTEAKKEYRKNKEKYINVDIGNDWIYRTDIYNLRFDENQKLVGIYFFLKNTKLSGVGYQNTQNALNMTKKFFEKLGYIKIYENEYWNYPLNFSYDYGLLMADKNKTKVVHLFPSHPATNVNEHTPGLILTDYNLFMEAYNERLKRTIEKQENTGF